MSWEWARRLREAEGWEAEVGYPADVTPPDFLDIVRINFLGSADGEHPPPRPLLENALADARASGAIDAMVERIASGERPEVALAEVARVVEERARSMLETGAGLLDNAPSTVAAKGANAPLRTPGGADRFAALLVRRVQRRPPG